MQINTRGSMQLEDGAKMSQLDFSLDSAPWNLWVQKIKPSILK